MSHVKPIFRYLLLQNICEHRSTIHNITTKYSILCNPNNVGLVFNAILILAKINIEIYNDILSMLIT